MWCTSSRFSSTYIPSRTQFILYSQHDCCLCLAAGRQLSERLLLRQLHPATATRARPEHAQSTAGARPEHVPPRLGATSLRLARRVTVLPAGRPGASYGRLVTPGVTCATPPPPRPGPAASRTQYRGDTAGDWPWFKRRLLCHSMRRRQNNINRRLNPDESESE